MLVKSEPISDSEDQDVVTDLHGRCQREDLGEFYPHTHDSISSELYDGHTFDGVVADLEAGRIDLLFHRKFKPVVIKWPGKPGSSPLTTGGHIAWLCVRQGCGRVEAQMFKCECKQFC